MMIRYDPLQTWKASQPQQAISLAVVNRIANEIEGYIYTSLTRMTAKLICILAAIFNLRYSRIKQHFAVKMDYIPTAHNRNYMHREEFIADNMIKVGYAVISASDSSIRCVRVSADWRSADRSYFSDFRLHTHAAQ